MVNSSVNVRCAKEFKALLAEVKLEFIRKGLRVPTNQELTKLVTKKLKKEDILYDDFIKF